MSRVGIVGVGAMGSGFAERLLARGHRVLVWNRTRVALEPLVTLLAAAGQGGGVCQLGLRDHERQRPGRAARR